MLKESKRTKPLEIKAKDLMEKLYKEIGLSDEWYYFNIYKKECEITVGTKARAWWFKLEKEELEELESVLRELDLYREVNKM